MVDDTTIEGDASLVDGASDRDLLNSWRATMPAHVTAAELAVPPFHDPAYIARRDAHAARIRALAAAIPTPRSEWADIPFDPAPEEQQREVADYIAAQLGKAPDEQPPWPGIEGLATDLDDLDARPPFRSAAELVEPADLDAWAIEGVCRPGTLVIVAGAEGVAKSQILRELGIRAATATGQLYGNYVIPRALRVMVCDEENGEAEEWRRETMILEAIGRERADLTGYFRVSFAGMVLTDPKAQAWLSDQAAGILPNLIILDTGTSMVADEWGPEMKAAIRFVRSLCVRFGCTVVIAVHLTKPSRDRRPKDALHGTAISHVMGQWTRQADAVALVADLGADRIRWEMRKKVPPSTLILAKRGGIFEVVSVGEERKPSSDDRVLQAISIGADSIDALVAGVGLSRSTIFRALARLRSDGLVGPAAVLELTDQGFDALA